MSSSTYPCFRASWTRIIVEDYERHLPVDVCNETLSDLRREIAIVRGAAPFAWIPADIHVAIVEAPRRQLSEQEYRDVWAEIVVASLERPLFKPILQGAVSLFGAAPHHFARVIGRAWGVIARDVGWLGVRVTGECSCIFEWGDIPPSLRAHDTFARVWLGALEGIYRVSGRKGNTTLDDSQLTEGKMNYVMEWTALGSSASARAINEAVDDSRSSGRKVP